jgi:hypothetical protein
MWRAKGVDVQPIADEIADKILAAEPDDRLRWRGESSVRGEMAKIFPTGSGYKQTVQGRRRRLRDALIERLGWDGWVYVGASTP